MWERNFFVLLLIALSFWEIKAQLVQMWTIVGSDSINEGSVYKFSAISQNIGQQIQANFSIVGNDARGNLVSIINPPALFPVNTVKSFVFDTSKLTNGQYNLTSSYFEPAGSKTSKFTWPLQFFSKVFTVVINTDKEFYKPADLIRFRLFAIDPDTKPAVIKSATVAIVDPKGFTIKLFNGATFKNGRYNGELRLPASVTTGLWTIRAIVGAQVFEKRIDVQDYDLPLYTATIVSPKVVSVNDKQFTVRVNVDYTFGKAANGVAYVSFAKSNGRVIFSKILNLGTDSGIFEVDILRDLGSTADNLFIIMLEFIDGNSGKISTASTRTRIQTLSTTVQLIAPATFRAKQQYKFQVVAKRFDGLPAPINKVITVDVSVQKFCTSALGVDSKCAEKNSTLTLTTNQLAIAAGEVATADNTRIVLNAKCSDCGDDNMFIATFYNPLFEIRILTANAVLYQPVEVAIETSVDIKIGFCHFQAKNTHLDLFPVTFTNGGSRFTFTPTGTYIPSTLITCAGFDINWKRYEAKKSVILEQLPNNLAITLSEATLLPGANSSLRITSALNSVVSLLAVDQRLLKLQNLNNGADPWVTLKSQILQFSKGCNEGSSFDMQKSQLPPNLIATTEPPPSPPAVRFAQGPEGSPAPQETVRRNFDETFLWTDVDIKTALSSDKTQGSESVLFTAPESITSYAVSGISIHETYGTGIPDAPSALRVFDSFFIMMDLPYSIKQSEILMQNVTIFNYMDTQQTGTLSITRDSRITIVDPTNKWQVLTTTYAQNYVLKPNSVQTFTIGIRPLKSGLVPIIVSARGPLAGDGIEKTLSVVPEGVEKVIVDTIFIYKQGSTMANVYLNCKVPETIDSKGVTTTFEVVGDILGDVLKSYQLSIPLPYYCSEQFMSRFGVNAIIYRFYQNTDQLTDAIKTKLTEFTQAGVQIQLTRRLPNGSFTFFPSNPVGSTWLTAFTVKIFRLAQDFMTIDQTIIDSALTFIGSKQDKDGSYIEDKVSLNYRSQGKLEITAFISILLNEYPLYKAARDLANTYLVNNVNVALPNELAITCYALYLAKHPGFDAKYSALMSLMTETPDMMFFKSMKDRTSEIETISYTLLFVNKMDTNKAIKLAKYLVSKKNSNGGWQYSQDTVMALEALASVGPLVTVYDGTLDILAWPSPVGNSVTTTITKANQNVLQSFDLDPQTRQVAIFARGPTTGKAIMSLTCKYFDGPDSLAPRFTVTTTVNGKCNKPVQLDICINYIAIGDDVLSNMVLMKLSLPSGYVYDPATPASPLVRKIETENANTKVIGYFDSMNSSKVCFSINAIQTSVVNNLGSALIEVLDYYSPNKKLVAYYDLPKTWTC